MEIAHMPVELFLNIFTSHILVFSSHALPRSIDMLSPLTTLFIPIYLLDIWRIVLLHGEKCFIFNCTLQPECFMRVATFRSSGVRWPMIRLDPRIGFSTTGWVNLDQ